MENQQPLSQEEIDNMYSTSQVPRMVGDANQSQAMAQYYYQEQEKNLAETQLEVDTIKTDIYHLLKQDVLRIKPDGSSDWLPIKNEKERTLTDLGVDRIMQLIHFYINKNTLLSNFDEKQIKNLMYRFVGELNDLVLLKYEILFRRASIEECKEILNARLEEKRKLRMYAAEIFGIELDSKVIKKEILQELEGKIEGEIEKIGNEQRKEKLREYGMIMAQIEEQVFATLNRAWRGEERGSIRRHSQITEVIGNRSQNQQAKGGISSWFKGM